MRRPTDFAASAIRAKRDVEFTTLVTLVSNCTSEVRNPLANTENESPTIHHRSSLLIVTATISSAPQYPGPGNDCLCPGTRKRRGEPTRGSINAVLQFSSVRELWPTFAAEQRRTRR
mmetsp:Transcript_19939/g.61909  ORF Transcript_19939/g.61909 Transcript_19939/m.61909 type:complete len:117 (-) Transcript_19939:1060-1410(-)